MELRTSAESSANGSSRPTPATAIAASRSKLPANTPRRAKNRRWSSFKRSKLQSMAARNVCCRAAASRPPSTRNSKRFCRRALIAAGVSTSARAAASSIASGRPSRPRQIAATSAAVASVTANPGRTAAARAANRATAANDATSLTPLPSGGGNAKGGTGHAISPVMPRGRRLVARIRISGHTRRIRTAISAAPLKTCSHVSSTSRPRSRDKAWATAAPVSSSGDEGTPISAATAAATR